MAKDHSSASTSGSGFDSTEAAVNLSPGLNQADPMASLSLLTSLLTADGGSYVWDPTDPATETYLADLEASPDMAVLMPSEAEAEAQWQGLAQTLASFWEESEGTAGSLMSALSTKFSSRMPQPLLNQVATQAQQAVISGQSLADQLLSCVQSMVPQLDPADWRVMARPLAYAMRDQRDLVDQVADSVAVRAWEDLGELEQARLSLAIARYAIDLAAAEQE